MIATGFLGETPYEVEALTEAHIPQLMVLQQEVVEALPDKAILQPLDEDELSNILQGNGLMVGVFVEGSLMAFRALLKPQMDAEHLGLDVGLTTDVQLKQVLYQEISNVHPQFRGYGLQRTMADIIMQQVNTTEFNVICATVMPFNIASLKDKFSQGMHVAALKYKYGGKLRYVFAKFLNEEVRNFESETELSMADTEGQQTLLKEGYIGISIRQHESVWLVKYVK
ncbi:N-acetyltransferase [Solibacillus sp. R5-41]|uniref:N-acetyltransferase n=1 Tax=Solibacillus sp. R5-41 TaxID=2048654 RepID=UPI000C126E27|nr:N-acetyltransferase [Solibacillus sp. R5-41]ATP38781.1 N-acetyltransferase [Solibacillus sp. R5-41]